MENVFSLNALFQSAESVWDGLDNSKILSTVILFLFAIAVRSLVLAWLEKDEETPAAQINIWKHRVERLIVLSLAILVLVIWAPELRALAVTMVAVAMAIVIALKEVITCFTGSIIRSTSEGARIGGRIIINGVHGDVTSTDMMSTTMLEVNDYGQRTGRTIVLPNSFFLTHYAVTETTGAERRFVLLTVAVPVKRNDDWQAVEQILLEVGEKISAPYIREARKNFARFNRRHGFNIPDPDPIVLIDWHDPEKISMNLRVAVPSTEQDAKRQEIWREVLSRAPVPMPPPKSV